MDPGTKRMVRARQGDGTGFDGAEQPAYVEKPKGCFRPLPHHDVLVIAPKGVHDDEEFYRFPVVKQPRDGAKAGQYLDRPELLNALDLGQRKVLGLGRPDAEEDPPWGPAFSTLPVKPEPAATSCATCYLINTRNLEFINAWTAEEWTDDPGGVDLPPAPDAENTSFEALLAGPRGQVFLVRLSGLDVWTPGTGVATAPDGRKVEAVSIDLRRNPELWQLLRNGTVAGRVKLREAREGTTSRVVPLVNITTLTPRTPTPDAKKGAK